MQEPIPEFLTRKAVAPAALSGSSGRRTSLVDKGLEHVAAILRTGFIQWETAGGPGFLQGLDARVKVLFLLLFIVLVSLEKTIPSEGAIGLFLFGLALVSRIDLWGFYRRVFVLTFFFGLLLSLPSACNLLTPGEIIVPLVRLETIRTLGGVALPPEIGLTAEGLGRVALLSLRVLNSLTVSFLVLATTPFMEFMKALKMLRVPDVFLMTIALTYKYIFIFASIVYDMHLARKSRLAGFEKGGEARRWTAGRIAFMYHKSRQRCEEVYKAMTARGLADTLRLRGLPPLSRRDRLAAAGLLLAAILFYRF